MKQLQDYLHYYFKQTVLHVPTNLEYRLVGIETSATGFLVTLHNSFFMQRKEGVLFSEIKPILRTIESMNEVEAFDFALLCMNSKYHLDAESQVTEDEMSNIELVKNDDGNLLDADVSVYIGVSVRCFEGGIIIRKDGSISVQADGEEHDQRIDDIAEKITWLLSNGFDLFGLIEQGLAVDAAKIDEA